MMNLREFAISQDLDRWDRLIRTLINRQPEDNFIVRSRGAKRCDE